MQIPNQYWHWFFNQNFQGKNRFFVLSVEDYSVRTTIKWCFLPKVEVRYHNVIIDARNIFDQTVKKVLRKYDKIWKTATG